MYEVVVEPEVEPLTVVEAKNHLRVDIDDDDAYIADLITVARRTCEKLTARKLIATTVDQVVEYIPVGGYMNRWVRHNLTPCDPGWYPSHVEPVKLELSPVLSLVGLYWTGADDAEQSLDATSLRLIRRDGAYWIKPADGVEWPTHAHDVRVRYVSGYGADATKVPPTIKHAMRLLIGTWYDTRESIVDGTVSELPDGVRRLLGLESWGADY